MSDANLPITGLVQRSQVAADVIAALAPVAGLLDHVFYDDVSTNLDGDSLSVWLSLALDGQVGFDLPGGFAIKIGQGDGVTPLTLGVRVSPAGVAVTVKQLAVVLAVPPSLLRPAPPTLDAEPSAQVELVLDGALVFDEKRRLQVEGFESVSLPRSFVGSTSIVVTATDVTIDTARGLILGEARVELPKDLPQLAPEELVLDNAVVGPNGVGRKLSALYTPQFDAETKRFTGRGCGEIGCVPFGFESIAIELRDNELVDGSLAGQLLLPFFDHPVGVSIALRPDGSFSIGLGGETPLATIKHEGLLRLAVQHLAFEVAAGRLVVRTGGTVTLLIGDREWPSFAADDVSIDSQGNIAVHGAGLRLRNGEPLDLGSLPAGAGPVPGVSVDMLAITGNPLDDGLVVGAEVSAIAKLGPVTATLQHVGVHTRIAVRLAGSGPVADELTVLPPSGIGLSVDAQGVLTGGGFLFHDPARQLYAGAMQLSLHDELTLSAYGLIATRLPDGRPGYSLLIFITADGFNPIPLGFGFMLQSIGGMVGIHRTFDHEVLKAGLKTDSLRTLLLPRDPVGNAPALIQALAAAFPAKRGSYLLGLLARITWFTPPLVRLDLALIQELGARERLLVLGRVSALLPSADNDLIRLNLDTVGVLDFDAGTVEADAVLVDSRLVHKFPITGSGALRARWPGAGRAEDGTALTGTHFVLAVGGLNPRFHAPARFPALERVTLALCSGDNPRLICDAYFAITQNTVQFGAHASLHARAAGVSINGDLGFDTLMTVVPPRFVVDFHASVQIKYKSHNLFKVALDGTLEGPLPLRIAARARFEILWFSFSVRFDFTLAGFPGSRGGLVSVSLKAELTKALRDPANWSTRRLPGVVHGVAIRSLPQDAGLVLDPLGQLMVEQQLVPLNTQRDIDTYGGATVTGARRFSLAGGLKSAQSAPTLAVQGAFAPARYFIMSDDEKLAAPSFEQRDAGLVLGDAAVSFGPETKLSLGYKTITVAPLPAPGTAVSTLTAPAEAVPPVYEMPWFLFEAQCSSGAAARAPVRSAGRGRFRNTAARPVAILKAPRWRIVPTGGGGVGLAAAQVASSWSEGQAALADLNRGGTRWRMVPEYELAV